MQIHTIVLSYLFIANTNGHYIDQEVVTYEEIQVDLIWCCEFMQKYSGFIPRETWGNNLIGAKNRYLREEWDERHCNQIIGSRTGKNCIEIENHRDGKKISIWVVTEAPKEKTSTSTIDTKFDGEKSVATELKEIANIRSAENETRYLEKSAVETENSNVLETISVVNISTTGKPASEPNTQENKEGTTEQKDSIIENSTYTTSTIQSKLTSDLNVKDSNEMKIDDLESSLENIVEKLTDIEENLLRLEDDIIKEANYVSTGDRGGCCFQGALGEAAQNPDDNYHRSCICPTATNMSECKSLCSQDQGCKGYTQHSNSLSCVLATTSLCPSSCHGPYKKDNIGLLDMAPSNCAQGEFNGGCYIKENVCCKDLILKFDGGRSAQESMIGEYNFKGELLNDRFVLDNKNAGSSLSFHSGFSRWQVTNKKESIVLSNYCNEACPEDCKDYFWELNINVLPLWQQYGQAHFVCKEDKSEI